MLNLDKVAEKVVSRLMISDMKKNIDSSQYNNQKGLSIKHYIVKMIDRILGALDRNSKGESYAVLATSQGSVQNWGLNHSLLMMQDLHLYHYL